MSKSAACLRKTMPIFEKHYFGTFQVLVSPTRTQFSVPQEMLSFKFLPFFS